jgi:hypothetical protein
VKKIPDNPAAMAPRVPSTIRKKPAFDSHLYFFQRKSRSAKKPVKIKAIGKCTRTGCRCVVLNILKKLDLVIFIQFTIIS